ncbi:MarR family winged helix-turn-helix transcriptional regulator [Herbaspirillum sp. RTI4]|uniref:MarR family winged helix-turn-helix transcriptional regulator n=1 Tax=Herbaspirillum sp. RTI4 TaxID=3048640 RepID=UPI002AB54D52|nr:MarR family winged helix-turn-helix transcriptional regulator [Herbaspirillum sp. RTI4]MDY7580030.1 MarR family winged helix-turn-helix transcriptional regulator [Herbaspirillum sp. RTI4]MEA9982987.1 MarR family winged helix-turn-helix transcriptional regulator [Herbaspirillum sp. RTI4]
MEKILDVCACSGLRRLSRRITAIYDHHLLAYALSITQYSLLARIGRIGPIANLQLAAEMGMERSTMSRTLKPLIAAKWIATVDMPLESGTDKRSFGLILTELGRQKYAQAQPGWKQAQEEIVRLLGESQYRELNGMVDASYQKLAEV